MVKKVTYIPDKGDLIWLEFNPQAGHEQAGVRPALVISPSSYNSKIGLALICPITSKVKGYPFEVLISGKHKIKGAILSDQIKSLDWKIRNAKFISKVDKHTMNETLEKIHAIIDE